MNCRVIVCPPVLQTLCAFHGFTFQSLRSVRSSVSSSRQDHIAPMNCFVYTNCLSIHLFHSFVHSCGRYCGVQRPVLFTARHPQCSLCKHEESIWWQPFDDERENDVSFESIHKTPSDRIHWLAAAVLLVVRVV